MSVGGGEGVVHLQPVLALRQQPLHVELQLGAGGSLEVPQAGGALSVGATESQGAAGHHLLVAVAVLGKGCQKMSVRVEPVQNSCYSSLLTYLSPALSTVCLNASLNSQFMSNYN